MLLIWVWTFASYICHSQLSLCQILISDPEQRISIFEDICPVMSKISFLLNWYFIARSVRRSIGLLPVGVKEFILNKRFASLSLVTLVCVLSLGGARLLSFWKPMKILFLCDMFYSFYQLLAIFSLKPWWMLKLSSILSTQELRLYPTNFTLQVYLFRTAVFRLAKKNWHEKGRISEV